MEVFLLPVTCTTHVSFILSKLHKMQVNCDAHFQLHLIFINGNRVNKMQLNQINTINVFHFGHRMGNVLLKVDNVFVIKDFIAVAHSISSLKSSLFAISSSLCAKNDRIPIKYSSETRIFHTHVWIYSRIYLVYAAVCVKCLYILNWIEWMRPTFRYGSTVNQYKEKAWRSLCDCAKTSQWMNRKKNNLRWIRSDQTRKICVQIWGVRGLIPFCKANLAQ